MTFPRRGEIWLVEFDPSRGHEIKKTRPAVIIQNDIGNRYSPVTIVAAVTSKLSPMPYPVEVADVCSSDLSKWPLRPPKGMALSCRRPSTWARSGPWTARVS